MTRLALFRYVGSHEETFAIDRSLWGSFGHRSFFCFPSLRSKDRLSRLHGSPGVLIARNPSVFFLTQYDSTDDTGNDVGLTDRLLIQRGREVGRSDHQALTSKFSCSYVSMDVPNREARE